MAAFFLDLQEAFKVVAKGNQVSPKVRGRKRRLLTKSTNCLFRNGVSVLLKRRTSIATTLAFHCSNYTMIEETLTPNYREFEIFSFFLEFIVAIEPGLNFLPCLVLFVSSALPFVQTFCPPTGTRIQLFWLGSFQYRLNVFECIYQSHIGNSFPPPTNNLSSRSHF